MGDLLQKLDPLTHLHAGRPLEIKVADVSMGMVEGYASRHDDPEPDAVGDRVARGAFTRSLARGGSWPMLLYHNPALPAGVWTEAKEDAHGLFVRGRVTRGTTAGDEGWTHLRAGSIKNMSIGFLIFSGGSRYQNGTRLLTDVDLHEISLTPLPAQRSAAVTSVKSFTSLAELADALAEGRPLIRKDAEFAARRLWPALNRDDPIPQFEQLVEHVARATERIAKWKP